MDVYVGYVREWGGGGMLVQEMELCQLQISLLACDYIWLFINRFPYTLWHCVVYKCIAYICCTINQISRPTNFRIQLSYAMIKLSEDSKSTTCRCC